MNDDTRTLIDAIVLQAIEALFEGLGVAVVEAEPEEVQTLNLSASIGFTSPALRGSLLLVTDHEFAKATRPAEVRDLPVQQSDLGDWIGELSNQLLGRVKNRLVSHGVSLELSTPTVVVGRCLFHPSARTSLSVRHDVRNDYGRLVCHFDAHSDADFDLSVEESTDDQVLSEGELTLF